MRDGRAMAIECDENICRYGIPNPNAAVRMANGEKVVLTRALGECGDLGSACLVFPDAQKLAPLDVPTEDPFIGANIRFASASLSRGGVGIVLGPDDVCSGRIDYSEDGLGLVLAAGCQRDGIAHMNYQTDR